MRFGAHTRRTDSIDEATRRAQEQIHAARLRAERDLERATKQANRALERSRDTMREHPMMIGAIAGTAIVGGLAAWLLSRKRSS
ncbi:hypothetical protein F6455_10160 [Proteobacteria bacterium 005FR1]|nr:hypothetical protein [Proteobacteria bacterium 005FR1]